MDATLARWVTSPEALPALERAASFADPMSLQAASAMRREWDPAQAAAALTQVTLRRQAAAKFGERAGALFFTPDGLQQATRSGVAAWRAARFAAAGVRAVVDVGCGIGADALAFADAGLDVVGVEADAATAVLAQANLAGRGRVVHALAEDVVAGLLGPGVAVFVDPSRRTPRGRSWRIEDLSPSWDFALGLLRGRFGCVKAAPGLDRAALPGDCEAVWVADSGDLVELSLWPGGRGRAAVLLPGADRLDVGDAPPAPVAPPGAFVYEPDPAVIRSGGVDTLARRLDAWRLAPGIAYLSADALVATPFARAFAVADTLPFDERTLRAWVRERQVGVLEIKTRGLDVDPAVLRKRLKPSGPASATLILTPTPQGAQALVVRRVG